jgi:hypothetical protein
MPQNAGDLAAAITEVVAASALTPAAARDLVRVTKVSSRSSRRDREGSSHGNGAETKRPSDPI